MVISLNLPLVLVDDDDLVRVSEENPGYQFEREDDGTLTVSPNHTVGGARSGEAYSQLRAFARAAGGMTFDSSAGFEIGLRGAVKCPDASWVSQTRIDALSADERAKFWPLSPDVAIEANSASDDFERTIAKVEFYVINGSSYGVAIDPATRDVVEHGVVPAGLSLDFAAIIDA